MRRTASASTGAIQRYKDNADHLGGPSTSPGPLLARVVFAAAMAATGLEEIFRSVNTSPQSSTAVKEINPALLKRVRALFDKGAQEFFEDGVESRFSRSLFGLLRHHGRDGIQAIADYLWGREATPAVAAEAMRSLADFDDPETLTSRWQLIKHALEDESPTVRDGAILAFANLNDPRAIATLAEAKMTEPIAELRRLIDQVLNQLQNIK